LYLLNAPSTIAQGCAVTTAALRLLLPHLRLWPPVASSTDAAHNIRTYCAGSRIAAVAYCILPLPGAPPERAERAACRAWISPLIFRRKRERQFARYAARLRGKLLVRITTQTSYRATLLAPAFCARRIRRARINAACASNACGYSIYRLYALAYCSGCFSALCTVVLLCATARSTLCSRSFVLTPAPFMFTTHRDAAAPPPANNNFLLPCSRIAHL